MYRTDIPAAELPLTPTLHQLIECHGIRATLAAFLRAALSRRRPEAESFAGSDHLRRDIGLTERNHAPPPLRGPLF